jgi:hypothetical protein
MSENPKEVGKILRLVGESLAYVYVRGPSERVVSFEPAILPDYHGQSFEELGIHEEGDVEVEYDRTSETIFSVKPLRRVSADREIREAPLPERELSGDAPTDQIILHPNMDAIKKARAPRAMKREARAFGKLVDCSSLWPGDLLLSSDLNPDYLSEQIKRVQSEGGYAADDARWSHAAMYLGDNANVVEATFENLQGNVRITSLDEYSQGRYMLRFRRSKFVQSPQNGWHLCVRALARLKQGYSFSYAAKLWWDVVIRGIGFYEDKNRWSTSSAVICSTLYADAYNEAVRRRLGEKYGGVCVPASLSVSDEFFDVDVGWVQLA